MTKTELVSAMGWLGFALYLILGTPGCQTYTADEEIGQTSAAVEQSVWVVDDALYGAAVEAAADWCEHTSYCPIITSTDFEGARQIRLDDAGVNSGACAMGGPGSIWIATYLPAGDSRCVVEGRPTAYGSLVAIITHELGHAAGLPDVDDTTSIMHHWGHGNPGRVTTTDKESL